MGLLKPHRTPWVTKTPVLFVLRRCGRGLAILSLSGVCLSYPLALERVYLPLQNEHGKRDPYVPSVPQTSGIHRVQSLPSRGSLAAWV